MAFIAHCNSFHCFHRFIPWQYAFNNCRYVENRFLFLWSNFNWKLSFLSFKFPSFPIIFITHRNLKLILMKLSSSWPKIVQEQISLIEEIISHGIRHNFDEFSKLRVTGRLNGHWKGSKLEIENVFTFWKKFAWTRKYFLGWRHSLRYFYVGKSMDRGHVCIESFRSTVNKSFYRAVN